MTIDSPRDLFLYELGIMRDTENRGRLLLECLADRVRNSDLAQILRTEKQASEQRLNDISSCLQALGVSPLETPSETVEGIYRRFEDFTSLQPSPQVLDQFALSTAMRYLYFGIASYRGLVDWAVLLGEGQCAQPADQPRPEGREREQA